MIRHGIRASTVSALLLLIAVVTYLAAGSLGGNESSSRLVTPDSPVPRAPAAPAPDVEALSPENAGPALRTLTVAPMASEGWPWGEYERDKFGPDWTDDNTAEGGRNGCRTRDDVLAEQLIEVEFAADDPGCTVVRGTLVDPYAAPGEKRLVPFDAERDPRAVQVDHVVALSAAWRQGAAGWSEEQRTALANDPRNLLAVNGSDNMARGDDTFDQWRPQTPEARCDLARMIITTKKAYDLSVTTAEFAALDAALEECGG